VNFEPKQPLSFILVKTHPFPVLLYLEWGLLLLGSLGVLLLPSPLVGASHRFPFLTVSIIIIFGLMGLQLPVRKTSSVTYTAIALALILRATSLGMRNRLFPFLPFIHFYTSF
jgi:hypothetical protein